jgi:hypothetical protein
MLVKPSLVVSNITDIEVVWLQTHGIEGIIFDLDNTIMAPNSGKLDDAVRAWLDTLQQAGLRCVVVSNNPHQVYLKSAQTVLNFPVLGNAAKPRRKWLRHGLKLLGLHASQVVVIGDRPLTDILGGQRLGAHTILVDPLTKATEHAIVRSLRRLERLFVIPH